MIKNSLKPKWAAGQPTINGWLSINSPFVAEIMAAQDYDSITIDAQHGAVSYEGALGMLQAMRATPGETLLTKRIKEDPILTRYLANMEAVMRNPSAAVLSLCA